MTASARPYIIFGLLFAACLSAQDFPYVISDRVGDVVDREERAEYGLFPGIADFELAQVFVDEESVHTAEITCGRPDSIVKLCLELTRLELQRLSYLIENADSVAALAERDEQYRQSLDLFWQGLLSKSVAEQPKPAARPRLISQQTENRIVSIYRGAYLGACAGGHAGAALGVNLVSTRTEEFCCLSSCGLVPIEYHVNLYSLDPVRFGLTAGLLTGAGAAGGYLADRFAKAVPPDSLPLGATEKHVWKAACGGGFGVLGIGVGVLAVALLRGTLYGRFLYDRNSILDEHSLEEDHWISWAPAVLTGIGIAVDVTYLGYVLGRRLDRSAARKALLKKARPEEP